MKTYFIYWVQGYEFYDKDKDMYMYFADIEVVAKSEKEAMEKAKKMVKKPSYRLKACYEKIIT